MQLYFHKIIILLCNLRSVSFSRKTALWRKLVCLNTYLLLDLWVSSPVDQSVHQSWRPVGLQQDTHSNTPIRLDVVYTHLTRTFRIFTATNFMEVWSGISWLTICAPDICSVALAVGFHTRQGLLHQVDYHNRLTNISAARCYLTYSSKWNVSQLRSQARPYVQVDSPAVGQSSVVACVGSST